MHLGSLQPTCSAPLLHLPSAQSCQPPPRPPSATPECSERQIDAAGVTSQFSSTALGGEAIGEAIGEVLGRAAVNCSVQSGSNCLSATLLRAHNNSLNINPDSSCCIGAKQSIWHIHIQSSSSSSSVLTSFCWKSASSSGCASSSSGCACCCGS